MLRGHYTPPRRADKAGFFFGAFAFEMAIDKCKMTALAGRTRQKSRLFFFRRIGNGDAFHHIALLDGIDDILSFDHPAKHRMFAV